MDTLDLYYDQVTDAAEEAINNWLRRSCIAIYDHSLIQEKACVDLLDRRAGFCKVFLVTERGSVAIPTEPAKNSPSLKLWENPKLGMQAAKSVFMMETKFSKLDGSMKRFGFTGFNVAPGVAITAGHCVDEYEGTEFRGNRGQIRGCAGSFVTPSVFRVEGFDCKLLCSTNNMAKYNTDNLPTEGSDFAITAIDISQFDEDSFILPCSYEYLQSKASSDDIAAYSFPHVTSFMIDAKLQLKDGSPPTTPQRDIWTSYKRSMEIRGQKLNTTPTRSELYTLLGDTFDGFRTGDKVASLGHIIGQTDMAIGGSYSTLGGSSGAPICPLSLPGYFVAVHDSASVNSDTNLATSTDNPVFVQHYKQHVVPRLPHCSSPVWARFDLRPFVAWLSKHDIEWKGLHTLKRKREDDTASLSPTSPMTAASDSSITHSLV